MGLRWTVRELRRFCSHSLKCIEAMDGLGWEGDDGEMIGVGVVVMGMGSWEGLGGDEEGGGEGTLELGPAFASWVPGLGL